MPKFLDELTLAYNRGLLVPFLGAGMSRNACPDWSGLVAGLEAEAKLGSPESRLDLASRAARAVRRLRLGSAQTLVDAVKRILSKGPAIPPAQTQALAAIHWPLVLTTNYDDLYVAAAHRASIVSGRYATKESDKEPPLVVLGRSRSDCRRVLTALRQPDVPILWALQGYVGGVAAGFGNRSLQWDDSTTYQRQNFSDPEHEGRRDELCRQLVIGHAEYRRVALSEQHFRRAFAEVFRSRSLLFLGAGLQDKYLLDLFSEVIELHGPGPHPHYAVLKGGEVAPDFLRDYYGIRVDEIEKHDQLPRWLEALMDGTRRPRLQQSMWEFAAPPIGESPPGPKLRIVRGSLPSDLGEDEWMVFSAGGTVGRPSISSAGGKILESHKLRSDTEAFAWAVTASGLSLGRHKEDGRYLAVNARLDPWTELGGRWRPRDPTERPINSRADRKTAGGAVRRDLRLIARSVEDLMEAASGQKRAHVHSMLLAAGRGRTFPQSHAFRQMLRGWSAWRSRCAADCAGPSLTIYVMADQVLHDLDSGRLDLASCLSGKHAQFWLDIQQPDGSTDAHLCTESADRSLLCLLGTYDVVAEDWRLDLIPPPCLGWGNWDIVGIRRWEQFSGEPMTLERFGLFSGTTLRCWRRQWSIG